MRLCYVSGFPVGSRVTSGEVAGWPWRRLFVLPSAAFVALWLRVFGLSAAVWRSSSSIFAVSERLLRICADIPPRSSAERAPGEQTKRSIPSATREQEGVSS